MSRAIAIPTSFTLHGQLIKVVFEPTLSAYQGNRGEALGEYNIINLQPRTQGEPQPQSKIEQAFFHELTHHILEHMESEKDDDEKFVNLFANLLHQALATAEYAKEPKK